MLWFSLLQEITFGVSFWKFSQNFILTCDINIDLTTILIPSIYSCQNVL